MKDLDGSHDPFQTDARFLCSHRRMDAELVDKLVLQLNRIHPQILSDEEAHRFRDLRVPAKNRVAELLKHLHREGEDACDEFYRALHIHAEDVYTSLPTRVTQREMADVVWKCSVEMDPERHVLNDRGPVFFLSCLSLVVGIAMLYYYRECETFRSTGPFLHCSAATQTFSFSMLMLGNRKNKAVKLLD